MKKIFLALLCLIEISCYSQRIDDYLIQSGIGVGRLKLGITKYQSFIIVGDPQIRENYSEALKSITELKSNPFNWVPFQIGFDSVFTYTEGSEKFPVYSLYFTNDTLNCISLSSFNYKKWWLEQYSIEKKVFFFDDEQNVTDSLPWCSALLDYSQGNNKFTTKVYYSKGLSVLLYGGKVKMVEIFPPVNIFEEFSGFTFPSD